MFGRTDPGLCPVCGAAHTACTSGAGAITSVMLPARDAELQAPPLVAELVQATLPPGQFTTAHYKRKGRP